MAAIDNIFLTGKIASLYIERTDDLTPIFLPCTSVSIATKHDTPDASNYNGRGFVVLSDGIQSAEITVEAVYDKGNFDGGTHSPNMPVIFAGMKCDLKLSPDGNRDGFLGLSPFTSPVGLPTSTESSLATNEYKASSNAGTEFVFENCTVSQVTYDVAVKDVQKIKLTLIPSATPTVNFADYKLG